MFENQHVLLVNTPRTHLQRFCEADVSSGLATRMALIECHGGGWESLLHVDGSVPDLIFVL
jgi:hypothetical protein